MAGKYEKYDYSKPFRVRIIQDCRKAKESLDGKCGLCLGLYEYPNKGKKMPEGIDHYSEGLFKYFPLIKTDSGKYIWGNECWWAKEKWSKKEPLSRLKKILELHVQEK